MKTKRDSLLAGLANARHSDARSRGATGSTSATAKASRRWSDAAALGDVLGTAHDALPVGERARDLIERFGADYDIALTRQHPPGTPRVEFDALSLIDAATAGLERVLRDAGFWEARVCAAWTGERHQIAIHAHGEGARPSRYCSSSRKPRTTSTAYSPRKRAGSMPSALGVTVASSTLPSSLELPDGGRK
jgi:hypothetical protein